MTAVWFAFACGLLACPLVIGAVVAVVLAIGDARRRRTTQLMRAQDVRGWLRGGVIRRAW